MAGYKATQVRKPTDETEFERNCVELFKAELNDPNAQRIGRRGQSQDGVDITAYRDRDPERLVGVQCKLKTGSAKLTADEVEADVKKALQYNPPLQELIFATTSDNDTRLDQLAQRLTIEQHRLGRAIQVAIWGWGVLQDKVNLHESAKLAFDAGWSPSLSAQTKNTEAVLASSQRAEATLAQISEKIDAASFQRLPQAYADRELQACLTRVLRRRGFAEADIQQELTALARRALDGDLVYGAASLRAEICQRAARSNAAANTLALAREFREAASRLDPALDLSIVDALLTEADGDPSAALRALRSRTDPDGRTATFSILIRRDRAEALRWMLEAGLNPSDFTAAGVVNLIVTYLATSDPSPGLAAAQEASDTYYDDCPVLLLLRAQLTVASCLPLEQRSALTQGLPLNPRALSIAAGAESQRAIQRARADIDRLRTQLSSLGIETLGEFLAEFSLWLRLEDPTTQAAARLQLAREIADPELTLRRVRLALAFDVPFDREALGRHLLRQKTFGGWTSDERFAALLLTFYTGDGETIRDFVEAHEDDLFKQTDLSHEAIAVAHVEALARTGDLERARQRLAEYRGKFLGVDIADYLVELVGAIESGDEVDPVRRRFEDSGSLADLRTLVALLKARRRVRDLARYAPVLARRTRTAEDFDTAMRALGAESASQEVLSLVADLPELTIGNVEHAEIHGWSLFHLGRVVEARAVARSLDPRAVTSSGRELLISTAVETGDWGYLQKHLVQQSEAVDRLPPRELTRLSRLAAEANSPYAATFRDAALRAAPDDPHVNLAAYMLAMDSGLEERDDRVQAWFQKAVDASGETGPVQKMSMRELLDRAPGWNDHADNIYKSVRRAETPLFVAASAVRRQLIDVSLGQALRNLDDDAVPTPILAMPGWRPVRDLSGIGSVALDPTAIFTLELIGLLDVALTTLPHPAIAPSTLGAMFVERQHVRVHQPSQIDKANRLQALLLSGRLQVASTAGLTIPASRREIHPELADLLTLAGRDGGVAVHSAPVTRLRSYLEEAVDMTEYQEMLTDTLSILNFLQTAGRVDASQHATALRYLHVVDKGWLQPAAVNASATIYLDDLTVTYLDHVGALEPLTKAVRTVLIHPDLHKKVQATLRHGERTADLLAAIERIRATLAQHIEAGTLGFTTRRGRSEDGEEDDREVSAASPTMDLLSNLTVSGGVVADDRSLNRYPTWQDAAGHGAASLCSLDVLQHLEASGAIAAAVHWQARHRLRMAGYIAVPIAPEELEHHLAFAPLVDEELAETPELRAIRCSIALPGIRHCRLPSDEPWLTGVRFAIWKAMRHLWATANDPATKAARASWLLETLPDPIDWCLSPEDEQQWEAALQQSAHLYGALLLFVDSTNDAADEFRAWLSQSLLPAVEAKTPDRFARILSFLRKYIPELVAGIGAEIGQPAQQAIAGTILNGLPDRLRAPLLLDESFRRAVGIDPRFFFPLGAQLSVETRSLHNALRRAADGAQEAALELRDGQTCSAELGRSPGGAATLRLDHEGFSFPDADLLTADRAQRSAALDRVFGDRPLLPSEQAHWRAALATDPPGEAAYTQLMSDLAETPEALKRELLSAEVFDLETLIPDDRAYYERLIGPMAPLTGEGISEARVAFWREMIQPSRPAALRRLAFSAVWRRLIPFDVLEDVSEQDVGALLLANDPFSLLFGFELCAARVARDAAYVALGTAFLERIVDTSEAGEDRFKLFSAAAITVGARLHSRVALSDAPQAWSRLATLAHAGVIADALQERVNAEPFLAFVVENHLAAYMSQTVVDRREAPRWRPEWILPEHVRAELVGRVHGALLAVAEEHRPPAWIAITREATEFLGERKMGLAAFYPGPFDDLASSEQPLDEESPLGEVLTKLEAAATLEVTGADHNLVFVLAAHARVADAFMRLASLPLGEPADLNPAIAALRLCAHVAASARRADLAEATVNRCLAVFRDGGDVRAAPIILIMAEACAARQEHRAYGEALGNAMRSLAFLIARSTDREEFAILLDEFATRDERLSPWLAPAKAIPANSLN
ncbi:hypothetical protein [uncultured Enterovirga sp.]|uniref:HTH domain-containing protein n=1 Tax=uncultured Enterovirga sp. TaxID=2026352 RepID=UPI0035CBD710